MYHRSQYNRAQIAFGMFTASELVEGAVGAAAFLLGLGLLYYMACAASIIHHYHVRQLEAETPRINAAFVAYMYTIVVVTMRLSQDTSLLWAVVHCFSILFLISVPVFGVILPLLWLYRHCVQLFRG